MEGGPRAVSGRAGMQADSEPCVAGIAGSWEPRWMGFESLGAWVVVVSMQRRPSLDQQVIWQTRGSFDRAEQSTQILLQQCTRASIAQRQAQAQAQAWTD
ncbi:hypothetical protein CFAM422_011382 [Trichoderma lentiforme]|uniref:Uncharacterized protein n=1 Tax=Trichoderma lentiforme TaxID=1567552 RepID=A0A9P5C9B6_9HYPO|nr:hypothetical protein CFAM422_011382 [Trichoderma lentiforme]